MPLPPERARAFEAEGKQGFVWGWEAGNKGLVSATDRAYMKAPVPSLWDKISQTFRHRDYMCDHTHLFLGVVLFSKLKWTESHFRAFPS